MKSLLKAAPLNAASSSLKRKSMVEESTEDVSMSNDQEKEKDQPGLEGRERPLSDLSRSPSIPLISNLTSNSREGLDSIVNPKGKVKHKKRLARRGGGIMSPTISQGGNDQSNQMSSISRASADIDSHINDNTRMQVEESETIKEEDNFELDTEQSSLTHQDFSPRVTTSRPASPSSSSQHSYNSLFDAPPKSTFRRNQTLNTLSANSKSLSKPIIRILTSARSDSFFNRYSAISKNPKLWNRLKEVWEMEEGWESRLRGKRGWVWAPKINGTEDVILKGTWGFDAEEYERLENIETWRFSEPGFESEKEKLLVQEDVLALMLYLLNENLIAEKEELHPLPFRMDNELNEEVEVVFVHASEEGELRGGMEGLLEKLERMGWREMGKDVVIFGGGMRKWESIWDWGR
jgi:hypothetical protein